VSAWIGTEKTKKTLSWFLLSSLLPLPCGPTCKGHLQPPLSGCRCSLVGSTTALTGSPPLVPEGRARSEPAAARSRGRRSPGRRPCPSLAATSVGGAGVAPPAAGAGAAWPPPNPWADLVGSRHYRLASPGRSSPTGVRGRHWRRWEPSLPLGLPWAELADRRSGTPAALGLPRPVGGSRQEPAAAAWPPLGGARRPASGDTAGAWPSLDSSMEREWQGRCEVEDDLYAGPTCQ
jgi:hypothetical protein